MYVTGGIGQTHHGEAFTFDYDMPNDTIYAETCASIGLVFFARRMLEMNPDSKYADVMELALHNGVLSGMALDGKSFSMSIRYLSIQEAVTMIGQAACKACSSKVVWLCLLSAKLSKSDQFYWFLCIHRK